MNYQIPTTLSCDGVNAFLRASVSVRRRGTRAIHRGLALKRPLPAVSQLAGSSSALSPRQPADASGTALTSSQNLVPPISDSAAKPPSPTKTQSSSAPATASFKALIPPFPSSSLQAPPSQELPRPPRPPPPSSARPSPPPATLPTAQPGGQCGPRVAICPKAQCCSQWGEWD